MDPFKQLADRLNELRPTTQVLIYGIVHSVSGLTCSVMVGSQLIEDVSLRATATEKEGHYIVIPKVGTAVLLANINGDLSRLVVLAVDVADRIEMTGEVRYNDGQLGGLVNIKELTNKINELVQAFNSHTHTLQTGAVAVTGNATEQSNTLPIEVPAVSSKAKELKAEDYEDKKIKH